MVYEKINYSKIKQLGADSLWQAAKPHTLVVNSLLQAATPQTIARDGLWPSSIFWFEIDCGKRPSYSYNDD